MPQRNQTGAGPVRRCLHTHTHTHSVITLTLGWCTRCLQLERGASKTCTGTSTTNNDDTHMILAIMLQRTLASHPMSL